VNNTKPNQPRCETHYDAQPPWRVDGRRGNSFTRHAIYGVDCHVLVRRKRFPNQVSGVGGGFIGLSSQFRLSATTEE